MSAAKALFTPLRLGAITIPNRIGMSALTRDRSVPDDVPNATNVEYYKQRAEGGAGLLVTEGVLVSKQGTEWPHAPLITTQAHVEGWKKVVDAVHSVGGHIFAQLWHVGRVAHPDAPAQKASGLPVYAPSAISARGGKFRHLPGEPGYVTPTAVPDPEVIIKQFKQGAINAKAAGFDGVELHGANGYIVAQFLDSTSNVRTDQWGGSIENRARFGLEVLKAVTEVFGADRVGLKVSPCGGYNDMGMPLTETVDTFSYFISEADKLGLAYIALVRYTEMSDPVFDGKHRAIKHDVLATYGHLITHAKVFVNAGVTPDEAEDLVSSKKVDGVFFGFLWVTHPDVAKRIEHGKPLDTAPDFQHLYLNGGTVEEQRIGYSDYPAATY